MNTDQVEGRWEQIKGRAKIAWAELTDDDFLKAEGSIDKLYGVIQERVGDSTEVIKDKLKAGEAAARWERVQARAKATWSQLTDEDFARAGGSTNKLHRVIHEKVGESEESIRAKLHPPRKN